MANIIAGRFDEQTSVDTAIAELRAAGFPFEHISTFYVTPAGQHARYRFGGDHDKSLGAEDTPKGTAAGTTTGGLVGAAIGAISTPLTGPIGAITGGLVGAHIGNLVGALGKMRDDDSASDQPLVRHSGLMVAVSAPTEQCVQRAVQIFSQLGASELEAADGHIIGGDWQDFDPASLPHRISHQPALGK